MIGEVTTPTPAQRQIYRRPDGSLTHWWPLRAESFGGTGLRVRDEAFQRYYTNPRYLEMVEQRFGLGMVEQLRAMTGRRLQRDLLNGRTDYGFNSRNCSSVASLAR